jgi:hypothetical protein
VTDTPIITLNHNGAIAIRLQRPYSQEFQLSLLELPALVAEIARVLPRDAHGVALIDQIIAVARMHRPRDLTNAERQRRFRQRRRAQQLRADRTSKESSPA